MGGYDIEEQSSQESRSRNAADNQFLRQVIRQTIQDDLFRFSPTTYKLYPWRGRSEWKLFANVNLNPPASTFLSKCAQVPGHRLCSIMDLCIPLSLILVAIHLALILNIPSWLTLTWCCGVNIWRHWLPAYF